MAAELIRRKRALEATMGKYRARAFDWRTGATCVHLCRFHLERMGHKPPAVPQLRSAIGARRALKERGWSDAGAMLDAIGLERIPPAMMLIGDLAMLASEDGIGSLVVSTGGKVIGWHEDAPGMVVMEPHELSAAWRV